MATINRIFLKDLHPNWAVAFLRGLSQNARRRTKDCAMPQGYLTTHVLDTARGQPAQGMKIDLYRIEGEAWTHLVTKVTNADGRTDGPILPVDQFKVGRYELLFYVGAYLDATGTKSETPRFLDEVPIRFGISEATSHYHVPLLISPFSFSTYRGS
jgi:5-hydroxyisourate hydrolase